MEKQVEYTTTNTYETLNKNTEKTKNVWLVFHGIGYLSRFFIRNFKVLNPDENYIICPQAPSKYYKDSSYKHVGASWLTKENTKTETENVLNYIDAILDYEKISQKKVNFIVLGYSQGVSIASRWLGRRKGYCNTLVMISGVFPKEMSKQHFDHLPNLKTFHTVGLTDEIFDPKNVLKQEKRLKAIFPEIKIINHEAGHVIDTSLFDSYK